MAGDILGKLTVPQDGQTLALSSTLSLVGDPHVPQY